MLLAHPELVEIVKQGYITDVDESSINAASIDLTLGHDFLFEGAPGQRGNYQVIDLSKRESIQWRRDENRSSAGYIDLLPGEFVLAHTVEKFFMPDDMSAEYSLKSSLARNGLEHMLAGWIDPGFTNSVLTLEFKNVSRFHALRLRPGMPIGQVKMFRHTRVAPEKSYRARGRYNDDASVQGIKP